MEQTFLSSIVSRLQDCKGRWPVLADDSGVPLSTVRKIAQGHTKNPGVETVDRLGRALDRLDKNQ